MEKINNNSTLMGLWRLQSFTAQDSNGCITHPIGHEPKGYINYLSNGFMMVQLSKNDRSKIAADSLFDLIPLDELREIVQGYNGYCGSYEVKENEVYHSIEMSLFPNLIGETIKRQFVINSNVLKLSDFIQVSGKEYSFIAIWEKIVE